MKADDILPEHSAKMQRLMKRQLELRARRFKRECWGRDRHATRLYKELLEIKLEQLN